MGMPKELHPQPNTWPVLTDLTTGRAVAFNPAMVRAIMPGQTGATIFGPSSIGWEVKENWETVAARMQGRMDPVAINRIPERAPTPTLQDYKEAIARQAKAAEDERARARSLSGFNPISQSWQGEPPPVAGWEAMDSAPRTGMVEVLTSADGPALKVVWRQGVFGGIYGWHSVVTGVEVKAPICWRYPHAEPVGP